jgi:hypothetical protein
MSNPAWTPLRQAEKKYKLCKGKRGEPTDLNDAKWESVLDLFNIDNNTSENKAKIINVLIERKRDEIICGL